MRNEKGSSVQAVAALTMLFVLMVAGAWANSPAPKTVIVVPLEDALVENSQTTFDFEGTAVAPESTVAAVQWRNNGGAWQEANGTDFWDFTATNLEVGSNLIEVRSRNAQGTNGLAVSKVISRKPSWGISCGEAMEITENGLYEYDLTLFPEAWHFFQAPAHGIVRMTTTNWLDRAYCINGAGSWFSQLSFGGSPVVAQLIIYEGETLVLRSKKDGNESPIGILSFSFEIANVQPQSTCATAMDITGPGSYHFFNDGERSNPCRSVPAPEIDKGQRWGTLWYRFTPEQDGVYDFSLRQNSADDDFHIAQIAAWFYLFPGDTCALECEDRIPWDTTETSGLLEASAGTAYVIALTNIHIDGWIQYPEGYGVLDVAYIRPLGSGTMCREAIPITEHGIHDFSNVDVLTGDPCRPSSRTQWFSYTSPGDGVILVETCGLASFDTFITVYKGDCPTSCSGRVAINDDAAGPCGLQSRVEFAAQEGQTYQIGLSGFGNDAGSGQFLIDYLPITVMVGDVVGSGVVNVSDVTELARRIANGNPPPIYLGDVNGDGFVDELDVQALAEMIVD